MHTKQQLEIAPTPYLSYKMEKQISNPNTGSYLVAYHLSQELILCLLAKNLRRMHQCIDML